MACGEKAEKVLRSAAERTGDNIKGFKNFYLKVKAGIWP